MDLTSSVNGLPRTVWICPLQRRPASVSGALASIAPMLPRMEAMVAPLRSTSGQKFDTEKRGTKATRAPTRIDASTPTHMAFMWNSGRGVIVTSFSLAGPARSCRRARLHM